MTYSLRILDRFGTLSVLRQSCLIVLSAVLAADLLTLIFYSIFFADRLLLDLALTSLITVIVGFPLARFFIGQQVRLAAMAARLDHSARTDGLTGLANRTAFFERAETAIAGVGPVPGALLFIDVDHFKRVNDSYGHQAGDAVLCALAAAIRASIRELDLAARIGGEEFAVFLTGADRDAALETAERIRQTAPEVGRGLGIAGLSVTLSIGVCLRQPGQTLSEMLLTADRNLYTAKGRGRDLVVAEDAPIAPPPAVSAPPPAARAAA